MKDKIGLVLGGGGARGLAYIGVMKALEENNINFDFIAGTSVGSLFGAAIAYGISSKEIYDIIKDMTIKDIRTNVIPLMPSKTDGIARVCRKIFQKQKPTFSDLKIPFCAVAADIRNGEEYDMIKGDLISALCASCAVPGVFLFVERDGTLLADGGIVNNIPASVARNFSCNKVISVDVNSTRGGGTDSDGYFDMLLASINIMMKSNSTKGYLDSDLMIQPDLKKFRSSKLTNLDDLIEEGYRATIYKMPDIKRMFGEKQKLVVNKISRKQIVYKV